MTRTPRMTRIPLTPALASASGHTAACIQMRRAGRTAWNVDDWNKAVEVQVRLLRHLGPPFDEIAADMVRARP